MALPSRPNARLNGLPSGPRSLSQPRSASATRERSRTRPEPRDSPPAPLRHQRSLSNLNDRGRQGRWERDAPPVPTLPLSNTYNSSPRASDRLAKFKPTSDRRDSDGSSSSSTSSASSGISGRSGYSTPATAADSEEYEQDDKFEGQEDEKPVPRGFGYSLWSRLQTAAANISVNVGKSWESSGALNSGEVTPPGQESRITRALKAYHIRQAKQPSDLPPWLFDEKERGVTSRLTGSELQPSNDARNITADYNIREPVVSAPSRSTVTNARPEYKKPRVDEEDRATMSRAAQRLKEMRDAKAKPRQQTIKFADSVHPRRTEIKEASSREPPAAQDVSVASLPSDVRIPAYSADVSGKRPVARGLPSSVRPPRRM